MNSSMSSYLIDSDVLITAKNRYYAFPICPGFWESVVHGHSLERIHSIDQVRQELLQGHKDDDLVQWVRQSVPADFFLRSNGEVAAAFGQVMGWVMGHPRYADEAKAKFAGGADGWLVAHAMIRGKTVITNEQPRPDSRSQVKLPDVCRACAVDFQDTFAMLRKLGIHFHFAPTRDGCRPHRKGF